MFFSIKYSILKLINFNFFFFRDGIKRIESLLYCLIIILRKKPSLKLSTIKK